MSLISHHGLGLLPRQTSFDPSEVVSGRAPSSPHPGPLPWGPWGEGDRSPVFCETRDSPTTRYATIHSRPESVAPSPKGEGRGEGEEPVHPARIMSRNFFCHCPNY